MLQFLELLAVISSACFGVLLARSKGMDVIGVFSVAFIVAFGGGTLRDVLLDRQPLFWIQREYYSWIVMGVAVVGALLPRLPAGLDRWLVVPDAAGMALFSVVGAGIALECDTSPFIASLFGVITGTFGGVMGDVVCNEVPSVFQPGTPLYATCAFVGCWVYLGAQWLGAEKDLALWVGVLSIVAGRLAAVRWNIRMPAPS